MGVTFAILLASGVLLGALAIVVDVGRLYVERGDLQNGADSAALALARACAGDAPDCRDAGSLRALAERYADDNAADGHTAVGLICGVVPGGVLPNCPPEQPGNLTGCLGDPPGDKYVEVHVSTELADGTTVLPPAFAQTLSGADAGTTVGACARAAWGPRDMTILAVTISICEFDEDTDDGRHFADARRVQRGDERVIQFWTDRHDTCGEPWPEFPWRPAGPAGFLTGGGDCEIGLTDGIVSGSTIDEFSIYEIARADCVNRIRQARGDGRSAPEIIYLPVHDGVQPDGPGTWSFRQVMVAPFVVTGFQFGAPIPNPDDPTYDPEDYREPSLVTGRHPCDTIRYRCLSGAFVGPPIPVTALTAGDRIRLVG